MSAPVEDYTIAVSIPCAVHEAAAGEPCVAYSEFDTVCWHRINTVCRHRINTARSNA